MSKVLIVEDEPRYREYLTNTFARLNYEVLSCENGTDSIRQAIELDPDILIVDWMLKNHLNGIHVARSLKCLRPGIKIILMTGFPSQDIRLAAQDTGVYSFLSKPFELSSLIELVRTSEESDHSENTSKLGYFRCSNQGQITFSNQRALDIFSTQKSEFIGNLKDFGFSKEILEAGICSEDWFVVLPDCDAPTRWHLRSFQSKNSNEQHFFLLLDQDLNLSATPCIEWMLKALANRTDKGPWQYHGRILVTDGEFLRRSGLVSQLQAAGAGCIPAENLDVALQQLELDTEISVILLDINSLPESDLDRKACIEKLKASNKTSRVILTSEKDSPLKPQVLSADGFLRLPFHTYELMKLLD